MIDAEARGAWRDLEAKLRPFVARRLRSQVDVDDVVQDVFLRMQRGLGALRDDQRFGPWVYQIARSAIVDHQRRASRHPVEVGDERIDELDDLALQESGAQQELASYLAPFVAALESPYREALTLTELEGLNQKEAAEMLGVSHSGMKSRVQRGRAQLRAALDACCLIGCDARGHVMSCERRENGPAPKGCCDGSE